jgi:tetraacyldisaccharide 4'-kinase
MATPTHWQHRGAVALLLLPIAAVFIAIAALRRAAWRRGLLQTRHPGVPVIVVGNITAGGTGKTPLTLWLAQFLQKQGHQPGIVSRGYGAADHHARAVPLDGDPHDYGDEPCLLARRAGCPVWVGTDRVAVAQALLAAHPQTDVIISDDGLQHYRLARDFEIAVIDSARGLGNGWPLPAGPLREPASRLSEVDAVVVNGNDSKPAWPQALVMTLNGNEFRNLQNPQHIVEAGHFKNRRVHAVAGIGNPQRFFEQLGRLGVSCMPHAFADHHAYTEADLAFAGNDEIVMSEKDAVKCETFANARQWALIVNAIPDPRLGEMILARLAQNGRHG